MKNIYNYVIINCITKYKKCDHIDKYSYKHNCNTFWIELNFNIDSFIKNFIGIKNRRFSMIF